VGRPLPSPARVGNGWGEEPGNKRDYGFPRIRLSPHNIVTPSRFP
jgi:hypothetical protein